MATKASFEPAPVAAAEVKELSPESLPTGTRLVQLGAFDSPQIARAQWVRLNARFRGLSGRQGPHDPRRPAAAGAPSIACARMGSRMIADARRFCSALVAENGPTAFPSLHGDAIRGDDTRCVGASADGAGKSVCFARRKALWVHSLCAAISTRRIRSAHCVMSCARPAGHEAVITVDQEGGRVQRLRAPHWRRLDGTSGLRAGGRPQRGRGDVSALSTDRGRAAPRGHRQQLRADGRCRRGANPRSFYATAAMARRRMRWRLWAVRRQTGMLAGGRFAGGQTYARTWPRHNGQPF